MKRKTPRDYQVAIESSGKDIYAPIPVGDELWIPTPQLESLLNEELSGIILQGLPLRTRSKAVKTLVCRAMGYPVPQSFQKKRPRFPGQELDIFTQKSLNLQVWNEQLSPTRRYAIIQIDNKGRIAKVKVINGQELALLDITGKITTKYQARLELGMSNRELVSAIDTTLILPHVKADLRFEPEISPTNEPVSGKLLSIAEIHERLSLLVGMTFADPGTDQERNRGAALHKLVCHYLGYSGYEDNGRFPDVRHQLLEVKLQTSSTIDLGLVLPNSADALDIPPIGDIQPRQCDTRYALFRATTDGSLVTLTHLFVTTGADFFTRFKPFGGNIRNGKLQIKLPGNFFDG